MRNLRRTVELYARLALAWTPAKRTFVRRSVASKYRVRTPKARAEAKQAELRG